jgi:hypothetical protein
MSDTTYQPRNYRKQNASGDDLWDIRGTLSFYGEPFTGDELTAIGRKTQAICITNLSTASTVLSAGADGTAPPILPSAYGTIWLSVTGTMTNGSARMFSAKPGQHLFINMPLLGGSTASVIIYCSGNTSGLSGAIVFGSTGSHCSSISLRQSAASGCWVHLYGVSDGTTAGWAVLEYQGTVSERMA